MRWRQSWGSMVLSLWVLGLYCIGRVPFGLGSHRTGIGNPSLFFLSGERTTCTQGKRGPKRSGEGGWWHCLGAVSTQGSNRKTKSLVLESLLWFQGKNPGNGPVCFCLAARLKQEQLRTGRSEFSLPQGKLAAAETPLRISNTQEAAARSSKPAWVAA